MTLIHLLPLISFHFRCHDGHFFLPCTLWIVYVYVASLTFYYCTVYIHTYRETCTTTKTPSSFFSISPNRRRSVSQRLKAKVLRHIHQGGGERDGTGTTSRASSEKGGAETDEQKARVCGCIRCTGSDAAVVVACRGRSRREGERVD